jgi:tetratricopeptide (TPR) repeat protein
MSLLIKIFLAGAIIAPTVYWIALQLSKKGSNFVGDMLTAPSGKTTPPIRQYSLADSFAARGKYEEAVQAYEVAAGENPDDPEPSIRCARVLRDNLKRFDDAAVAYRRALNVSGILPATEVAVLRELIELYTHKLETPEKALPYLSRLSSQHASHPAAAWARAEAQQIRNQMGGNDADTR